MRRNWKLLRTSEKAFTKAWQICWKRSKGNLAFMTLDQGRRLQTLAPKAASGNKK